MVLFHDGFTKNAGTKFIEAKSFFPEEKRIALKVAIEGLPPEKLEALKAVLEKGLQKQTQLFIEAQKQNPHLFFDIRNMVRGKEKVIIQDKEILDRKEEQTEISELEAQIEALFE